MRVYLHTFGCKANQYDTERVREAVKQAGAVIVDHPAHADAAVVNSCTVTHVAEAKMRGLVRRLSRQRSQPRTVVMGCAAALDNGSIAGLPGVAAVVSGADVSGVLTALDLPANVPGTGRSWLRIQDGCDEHCTFCATTLARGASRSRPVDEIVAEAGALAVWHGEIVLTGVHIGSFGADRGLPDGLSRLLEQLVLGVPGVRFRLSSVEATEVDDRLAELMIAAPDRVAPHLHAPLQSGSDPVLRRMGRHWYTSTSYRRRVEWLVERLPVLGLGADVMAGFPGESEKDHAATLGVIHALPFSYLHVFPYSERHGTAARRLGSAVSPPVAARRATQLRELSSAKAAAYRASRDGQVADIVICGRSGGWYQGLTEDYLSVRVSSDGPAVPRFSATLRVVGEHVEAARAPA